MTKSEINQIYVQNPYLSGIRNNLSSIEVIPVVHLPNWFDPKFYSHICAKLKRLETEREDYPLSHKLNVASIKCDFLGDHTMEYIKTLFGISESDLKKVETTFIESSWQDYKMIMDDDARLGERILIVVDFSDPLPENCGGELIFTNEGESSRLKPAGNSMTIVRARDTCQMCIGYINHYAEKNKRRLVVITLELRPSALS